jgi:hypothetical protein
VTEWLGDWERSRRTGVLGFPLSALGFPSSALHFPMPPRRRLDIRAPIWKRKKRFSLVFFRGRFPASPQTHSPQITVVLPALRGTHEMVCTVGIARGNPRSTAAHPPQSGKEGARHTLPCSRPRSGRETTTDDEELRIHPGG